MEPRGDAMIGNDLEQALVALCFAWALVGLVRAVRGILSLFKVID